MRQGDASSTSVTFRANLPKFSTTMKMFLRSYSSIDYRSITLYTSTYWSTTSHGWVKSCFGPNLTFNWRTLWRVQSTTLLNVTIWREDELGTRNSDPCPQPDLGATYLQEAGSPDSLSGATPSVQSGTTLHPLRLPINEIFNAIKDQRRVRRSKPIKYKPILPKQKSTIPSTTVRDTRPSTIEVSDGTWKNLSANASSKSTFLNLEQSLVRTTKRSASYPITTCNHPVQSDYVTWIRQQGQVPQPHALYFLLSPCIFVKMRYSSNYFRTTSLMGVPPISLWHLCVPMWECLPLGGDNASSNLRAPSRLAYAVETLRCGSVFHSGSITPDPLVQRRYCDVYMWSKIPSHIYAKHQYMQESEYESMWCIIHSHIWIQLQSYHRMWRNITKILHQW